MDFTNAGLVRGISQPVLRLRRQRVRRFGCLAPEFYRIRFLVVANAALISELVSVSVDTGVAEAPVETNEEEL